MKRKTNPLSLIYSYSMIPLVLLIFPTKVFSQNSAVIWSTFDMGFEICASSNTSAKSAIGLAFVGRMQQGATRIENGFLADTLIRSVIVSTGEEQFLPLMFSLRQNYPNPFNPATNISFSVPMRSFVSVRVFDLLGREVSTIVSEVMSAGNYTRQWNATEFPSGVYFYRLTAGNFIETKKLIILR